MLGCYQQIHAVENKLDPIDLWSAFDAENLLHTVVKKWQLTDSRAASATWLKEAPAGWAGQPHSQRRHVTTKTDYSEIVLH